MYGQRNAGHPGARPAHDRLSRHRHLEQWRTRSINPASSSRCPSASRFSPAPRGDHGGSTCGGLGELPRFVIRAPVSWVEAGGRGNQGPDHDGQHSRGAGRHHDERSCSVGRSTNMMRQGFATAVPRRRKRGCAMRGRARQPHDAGWRRASRQHDNRPRCAELPRR